MAGISAIQWTDRTWNPTTGCTRVSPGCDNCYAFALHDKRFKGQHDAARLAVCLDETLEKHIHDKGWPEVAKDLDLHGPQWAAEARNRNLKLPLPKQYDVPFSTVQVLDDDRLAQPLRWRKSARIFVDSMSDLFHEDIPDAAIYDVFRVMAHARQHTFQVLTKRPERMSRFLDEHRHITCEDEEHEWHHSLPLANVWLGVSVEDQERAAERLPLLVRTPAAVHFVSAEPLLGPLDLYSTPWLVSGYTEPPFDDRVDWVIVGGESGPHARPFDVAWARSLREQCEAAGVAFFMKQIGKRPVEEQWSSEGGHTLGVRPYRAGTRLDAHGGNPDEWPEDLRVREFPREAVLA